MTPSSPFFLVRFVFLGLLSYFSLVILIVSSWYIKSSSFAELPTPGAAVLLLVLSIFSILFNVGALLPLFYPTIGTSQVRFECTWLFFMTLFELASCIALAANGPVGICRETPNWFVCASGSILLPASWICSTIRFSYFLTLLIACFMHANTYPMIWDVSFYVAPWFSTISPTPSTECESRCRTPGLPARNYGKSFEQLPSKFNNEKTLPKVPQPHAIMLAYEDDIPFDQPTWMAAEAKLVDIETGTSTTLEIEQAPWAEGANKRIKRGIDVPFASLPRPVAKYTPDTSYTLPSLPPQSAGPDARRNGSRFLEHVRESHIISRVGGKIDHCMTSPRVGVFPETVADYDKPIPIPTMSSWIRADANRDTLRTASSITAL